MIAREAVGDFVFAWPVPIHLVDQNVFGHIDKNWTGAACCRNVESLRNHKREILRLHDELVVLSD